MTDEKAICPVCGMFEFTYPNSYEICPVCEWENCEYQMKHPNEGGFANELSLDEARTIWARGNGFK